MSLAIVPMEGRHLNELAEISRLCFSMPWSRDGLAAELSSDTAHFWVAEEAGRCLGFAGMHAVCGECYVDLVAVHPAERRPGDWRTVGPADDCMDGGAARGIHHPGGAGVECARDCPV